VKDVLHEQPSDRERGQRCEIVGKHLFLEFSTQLDRINALEPKLHMQEPCRVLSVRLQR
jgi:hypothetical protein